jgi:thiamine pyrophosphokinase
MKAVIVLNGELADADMAKAHAVSADLLIAADGGADHLAAIGLTPHAVIGDMDSISQAVLNNFEQKGVLVRRYPPKKDDTDLELALGLAVEKGAGEILILGALGGRWDMSLSNLMALAIPAFAEHTVRLMAGFTEITRVRGGGRLSITGTPGDTVSLIPVAGPAIGVELHGFEYPLNNEDLGIGSSRGVSNVLASPEGTVRLKEGLLICVHLRQSPNPALNSDA